MISTFSVGEIFVVVVVVVGKAVADIGVRNVDVDVDVALIVCRAAHVAPVRAARTRDVGAPAVA
jgi:predicted secreted protein